VISRGRAKDRSEGDKRLVGFVVDDVHYALDIGQVREIVNPAATAAIPHMPPAVLGLADHRGEVIPIVDAREHFGLPRRAPTRATKWILVKAGSELLGLVVDRVTDVFGSSAPPREPPSALGSRESRGVSYVAARGSDLVFVLDAQKLAQLVAGVDRGSIPAPDPSSAPPPVHASSAAGKP
jgi:purine-binding chemotaxis protein CheW